jgi:hypothetical protein
MALGRTEEVTAFRFILIWKNKLGSWNQRLEGREYNGEELKVATTFIRPNQRYWSAMWRSSCMIRTSSYCPNFQPTKLFWAAVKLYAAIHFFLCRRMRKWQVK